jgi:hypothetical protein
MLTTLLEISQNDIYAGDWLRHKNTWFLAKMSGQGVELMTAEMVDTEP